MAAKPHVVRNGYIALTDLHKGDLQCWRGDIIDVPLGWWVEQLTRAGVISPDVRPPEDSTPADPVPPVHVPDLPPEAPLVADVAEVDASGGEARADEAPAGEGDAADETAPAPKPRGRPRKTPVVDTASE